MKGQIAQALEERLAPLTKRIEKLEQCLALEGVKAIAERSAEEDDITRQINALMKLAEQAGSVFSRTVQKKLQSLAARLALLPSAPRIEVVQLVQSILAQQNPLILITDDTVNGRLQRPELTRIFVMELTGTACFDYQFPSISYEKEGPQAMEKTVDGDEADPLPASLKNAWTEFHSKLHGRYIIAFDLPFVEVQLAVTAHRYNLVVPMLVGHSLLDLLLKYTRVKEPIGGDFDEDAPSFSDAQLCGLLAEEDVAPFVDLASSSADQRALHLLHALQAMANGTLSLQEPLPISTIMQLPDPFSENGLLPF